MKKLILLEAIRRMASTPKRRKKLKVFVAISLVGVLATGALAIWAGVAAFNYLATTISPASVAQKVEAAKQGVAEAPALLRPGCLNKAQSMLSLTQWLERPVQQSFRELVEACVEKEKGPASTDMA